MVQSVEGCNKLRIPVSILKNVFMLGRFLDGALVWVFFWNLLFEARVAFISDKRVSLK